jgi:OmpA-OmpF porin, OOP family
MKKVFAAIVLLSCISAKAQFTYDYLKAADNYFRKADYYSAAQYYEKYLSSNGKKGNDGFTPYVVQKGGAKSAAKGTAVSTHDQAVYNLAESYRLLNYHVKAEPYYKEATGFDKTQFPLARFHYASTLRALERYEEAERALTEFLAEYTMADEYKEKADREIQNLRYIQAQLKRPDLERYTIAKAASGLNSTGASYAPVWLNANMLLFTSTRPENDSKNPIYTNRIYQAVYTDGVVGNVVRANLPQAKDLHQGVATVTPDGNTMFLTRWTIKDDKKNSAIYTSTKNGDNWSEPVMLDGIINSPGANSQQPYMMPDGKHMLYASDKQGGQGGFDLWSAELDASGKVVSTVNLGSGINTKFDEQAPFFHQPTGTMVFSTNGRVGMGGYDFFFTKEANGNWTTPENFGYPVNSVKDDIYFTSRGGARNILEDVILSSDRAAECCLEMFSLRKTRPMKVITGLVTACESGAPLSGVMVRIVDTINGKTIHTQTTDVDGRYSFTLEDFQLLKAEASMKGYITNNLVIMLPADLDADNLNNPALCITKPVVVLDNIYYEFNKAILLEESFPSLDKLYNMLVENPNMRIEIGGHTDSKGSNELNRKLSEARAQSVVDYLVGKGIDIARLEAKGYGASRPIAPNTNPDGSDNPDGRQKNRRTEFRILNY